MNKNYLKIDIKDTGTGIKKESMTNLFKAFGKLSVNKHINE